MVPVVGNAVPLITVDGSQDQNDPDFYNITITAAGEKLPTINLNTGGSLTQSVHEELVEVLVSGIKANVRAFYRYDPSQVKCTLGAGGQCLVSLGGISPSSIKWLPANGPSAELDVAVSLEGAHVDVNGANVDINVARTQYLRIPLVGQVTAIGG